MPSCGEESQVRWIMYLPFHQVRILAAHKIYGIPQTINTANHVYFLACQELLILRNSPATSAPRKDLDALVTGMPFIIFGDVIGSCFSRSEELLSLHRGQGLEILWRDSPQKRNVT